MSLSSLSFINTPAAVDIQYLHTHLNYQQSVWYRLHVNALLNAVVCNKRESEKETFVLILNIWAQVHVRCDASLFQSQQHDYFFFISIHVVFVWPAEKGKLIYLLHKILHFVVALNTKIEWVSVRWRWRYKNTLDLENIYHWTVRNILYLIVYSLSLFRWWDNFLNICVSL